MPDPISMFRWVFERTRVGERALSPEELGARYRLREADQVGDGGAHPREDSVTLSPQALQALSPDERQERNDALRDQSGHGSGEGESTPEGIDWTDHRAPEPKGDWDIPDLDASEGLERSGRHAE